MYEFMLYVNKIHFIWLYNRPRKCTNLFVRFTLEQRSILTENKTPGSNVTSVIYVE